MRSSSRKQWLTLVIVTLIAGFASRGWAQDTPREWGFDGGENPLAGDWSMAVNLSLSSGCSQSWEHTTLQGQWTLQVDEKGAEQERGNDAEVELTLQLAGESSIGSWQTSQGTSTMTIEDEEWRWRGHVLDSEEGVVLQLELEPDGTCTEDRAELGLCMLDAPLELHCEPPEKRVLSESSDRNSRTAQRTILSCALQDLSRVRYPVHQALPEGRLYLSLEGGAQLNVYDDMLSTGFSLMALIDGSYSVGTNK